VLAELLPASVHAVEVFDDPPEARLLPEEEAYVARAVEARRREFTTGRHCARVALGRLGVTPTAITRGELGAPGWPEGVVGSITHCAGYRAAAVARVADLITIGIDAEPNEPLPDRVLDIVALPPERAMVAALASSVPDVAWDRLLFSAKESIYKAWAPLTGTFLDFDGADIAFDPEAGTFIARLLKPGASLVGGAHGELAGRFVVRDGLAVTAIARVTGPSPGPPTVIRLARQHHASRSCLTRAYE
jgi:4'-phosphopantetheinyl transferase EntD